MPGMHPSAMVQHFEGAGRLAVLAIQLYAPRQCSAYTAACLYTFPVSVAATMPSHVALPLYACRHVTRPCPTPPHLSPTRPNRSGKTVMFDCGIHPGYHGMQSLPYFDLVDLSTIDVALITHFHLDHCAAVPYLVGHTNFKASPGSISCFAAGSRSQAPVAQLSVLQGHPCTPHRDDPPHQCYATTI